MCVGAWTLDHPEYALILCTNRDEYLERPTTDAHWHSFGQTLDKSHPEYNILSGTDIRAGGTWLGMSRRGKFAVLTNITEPAAVYTSSRGHLVSSFLTSDKLDDAVGAPNAKYAGFNMVTLSPSLNDTTLSFDACFVTNHGGGGEINTRPLSHEEREYGAFSNGVDGAGGEAWPKVQQLLHSFKAVIQSSVANHAETELTERLFEILEWRSPSPPTARSELRNTVLVDPIAISVETDPKASRYGTRLHTVIFIRRDGQVLFIERDAWKLNEGRITKGESSSDRVFTFTLNSK